MPSPPDPVLQFDSIEDTIQAFSTLLPTSPLVPLSRGLVAFPRPTTTMEPEHH